MSGFPEEWKLDIFTQSKLPTYSTLITMFELLILFSVSNAVAEFLQATPIQSCSTVAENRIETMRKLFCGTATKLANYYLQVVVLINEKII